MYIIAIYEIKIPQLVPGEIVNNSSSLLRAAGYIRIMDTTVEYNSTTAKRSLLSPKGFFIYTVISRRLSRTAPWIYWINTLLIGSTVRITKVWANATSSGRRIDINTSQFFRQITRTSEWLTFIPIACIRNSIKIAYLFSASFTLFDFRTFTLPRTGFPTTGRLITLNLSCICGTELVT